MIAPPSVLGVGVGAKSPPPARPTGMLMITKATSEIYLQSTIDITGYKGATIGYNVVGMHENSVDMGMSIVLSPLSKSCKNTKI